MSDNTTSDADACMDGVDSSDSIQLVALQTAILALKHMRKETRQLTKNFENLKSEHLTLVTSHTELQLQHQQLKQQRVSEEQQYRQLCKSWREKLEEKHHHFERGTPQTSSPRDLEPLTVQLLEQIEAPFKAKCEAITKEAEATKLQLAELRSEHEALQNNIRSQELLHKSGLDVLQGQYDALQDKVAALEATASKAQQLEEQLRNAQQDKDDVALQLRVLQEEALELRKAKEAAVIEKEQLTTRLESESHQLQSELKEIQGLADTLTCKNKHLEDELQDSIRAQGAAHTEVLSLQASNMSLSSQLADAQTAVEHERQLHMEQIAAAEQEWQGKSNELIGQVAEKEKQVAHLIQSHEQNESAAADKLTAMQDSAASKEREAALQIEDLTKQLVEAQKDMADMQVQLAEAQSSSDKVAMLQIEVTQLRCELQGSQQQLKAVQQQMVDVAGQRQALEAARALDIAERAQSEARSAMLEQRVPQLEQELSDAMTQVNIVRELQQEADKRFAAAKQAAAADCEALGAKHATRVRMLQEAAKDQVHMLRSKLRDSRATVQELQSEISNLKISLHEKEAGVLGFAGGSMEWPNSPGSPGRWLYDSPNRLRGSGSLHGSPARTVSAAATAGVQPVVDDRQKQPAQGDAAAE